MTNEWAAEFRLSITRALADQLATTLAPLVPAPLNTAHIPTVRTLPGVYTLFLDEERVYVGKAAKSLQDRLNQHSRKLSGRTGLDAEAVRFVCVYVDEDLDAAAPEKLLIKKYRQHASIPWNTNGFGNKDPGRNRDTSVVKAAHFDAIYPIDLDYQCQLKPGPQPLAAALDVAKGQLPYLLRYETSAGAKKVYRDTSLTIPDQPMSTRALANHLIAALPNGWQLTALPGYLILYREERGYDSALGWWRRQPNGEAQYTPGPLKFAAGGVDGAETDPESGEPTSSPELDA